MSTRDEAAPLDETPVTPGDGYRLRHRIVAVRMPGAIPDRIDGYDAPDFLPAMRALLAVLRAEAADEPDPDLLDVLREEMPADLKALLLTIAYRGDTEVTLPIAAATDMQLMSAAFGFPATDNELYYRDDGRGGRYFAPDGLESDYVFALGVTPDGEVHLYATWNAGDSHVSFGTCDYGGYHDDDVSERIGDIEALRAEVADWIDEVDDDLAEWTDTARRWLELAGAQGSG